MPSPIFLISLDQQFLSDNRHLAEQSRQLAQDYQEQAIVIEDSDLQKVGTNLWQALDCETKFLQQNLVRGQDPLHIVIESDNPKVLNLAWETLYHPKFGFFGQSGDFTLSRRLPIKPNPELPSVECTPLRILLFASMPMDLGENGRLQIEEEKTNILQAVTPLEDQGLVELIAPEDGRFESFKQALQDYRPHLVYLSGHGSLHHNIIENTYHGRFLFEDEYANSLEVSEDDLVLSFDNSQIQAIILSACESGKFDPRDLNNGLNIRLAQKGIPHVIGMRESILDNAGMEFAVTFLEKIAKKQSVAVALQAARHAIRNNCPIHEQNNHLLTAITEQQWCLPSLYSHDVMQPLVDWSFIPRAKENKPNFSKSVNNISLPEQFLGRKRELYKLLQPLLIGSQKQLLLTGAGGVGKTALAGKLCQQLKQSGYEVFSYSVLEGSWRSFVAYLEFSLMSDHVKEYDDKRASMDEQTKALFLLTALLTQHDDKVVLFVDNLEVIQDPQNCNLTDDIVKIWLEAAKALSARGLRTILTSRWCLPSWKGKNHHLEKPAYSDFIAFARHKNLLTALIQQGRTRQVYDALGGNFRAFEFFVNGAKEVDLSEAKVFVNTLHSAKNVSQVDMALDQILGKRSTLERKLLNRLLAFPTAVPIKGISVIAKRLTPCLFKSDGHIRAIETLVNVSLVEKNYNREREEVYYQLAPLVRDYLSRQAQTAMAELLSVAADYLYNDLLDEGSQLDLVLLVYNALLNANSNDIAQHLLLDRITGMLGQKGLYNTLLDDYLIPSLGKPLLPRMHAVTLGEIGKQYLHVCAYNIAIDYLKQSLAIQKKMGDKFEIGTTLSNISLIFKVKGDYGVALKYLKNSLAIRQKVGDKLGTSSTLNNMATTTHAKGNYEAAFNFLKQSLAIKQEIGDKSGISKVLNNMGTTAYAQGDYEVALKCFKQSLTIKQEVGDKPGVDTLLNNISQIYHTRGDHETALNYLKQSLVICQEINNKSGESAALNNISHVFEERGDCETALDYLKQSLAIQQEIGDKSGEGTTLNNIAQIFKAKGGHEIALDYLKQSLVIRQEIGDKSGEGTTLNNISQIFKAKNDYEVALNFLEQSLAIRQEIGDKPGEGVTLYNISQIYDAQGDYQTTLNYLNKSLAIRRKIGDKFGEGSMLYSISQIYNAQNDYQETVNYLKQSLTIQQEVGDESGICATLFTIGCAHAQNEEMKEAISVWTTLYVTATKLGEAQALASLEELSTRLGFEGGLVGWEKLAKQE